MNTTQRIEAIMDYLKSNMDTFEFQRYKSTKGFYGFWIDIDTPEVQARVVPIRSYNTIVGYVDCDEEVFYAYGKYSSSTTSQVRGMYKQFWSTFAYEEVDVNPSFVKLNPGCRI